MPNPTTPNVIILSEDDAARLWRVACNRQSRGSSGTRAFWERIVDALESVDENALTAEDEFDGRVYREIVRQHHDCLTERVTVVDIANRIAFHPFTTDDVHASMQRLVDQGRVDQYGVTFAAPAR